HYFGTHRGVRGFADKHVERLRDGSGLPVFAQPGYPVKGYGGHLFPFRLVEDAGGECTHDVTHDWGPQHRSWNRGAMDGFVREQLRARGISWKAYASSDNYGPTGDMPFPLFKQFHSDPGLAAGAFSSDFPSRFEADCASGELPQVSWVWGPITHSEHPPAPV